MVHCTRGALHPDCRCNTTSPRLAPLLLVATWSSCRTTPSRLVHRRIQSCSQCCFSCTSLLRVTEASSKGMSYEIRAFRFMSQSSLSTCVGFCMYALYLLCNVTEYIRIRYFFSSRHFHDSLGGLRPRNRRKLLCAPDSIEEKKFSSKSSFSCQETTRTKIAALAPKASRIPIGMLTYRTFTSRSAT